MPLYVIERTFAEEVDLSRDDIRLIEVIHADEGVRWVFSFLSADKRRSYCVYEAPSAAASMSAAKRGDLPADAIVEVQPDAVVGDPSRVGVWAAAQAAS